MTALQADVAALQTLVSMIKAGNFGGWDKSWRAATHLKTKDALPAIERLLGIVSGAEKLSETHGYTCRKGQFTRSIEADGSAEEWPCTCLCDELKALLDREK